MKKKIKYYLRALRWLWDNRTWEQHPAEVESL